MLVLTRTVRFAVSDDRAGTPPAGPAHNGFAGFPAMRGLGRHYEFDVACGGDVDPVTGYSLDIQTIDRGVREVVTPLVVAACRDEPFREPGDLLPRLVAALNAALGGRVARLTWRLTPYYTVAMEPSTMNSVLIRQQFEFAASHRLHVASMSDEENRRMFGKCNNPRGHGHNYRVEPSVAVALGRDGRQPFTLTDLERITDEVVIRRFDHKNLNAEAPEFASLNPSVENIAKVAFDLLKPAIARGGAGAELRSVTVWETEKTSATYPG